MKQTIDIKLFKENPELFFSYLPEKAEKEIFSLLEFILFKYNLTGSEQSTKKDRFKLFKEYPIEVEHIKKYSREDLNER